MSKWNQEEDGLSPLAIGYGWAMRILSLAIEVALVILAGHWLDLRMGTAPWFLIGGTFLGLTIFFVQIISMTKNQTVRDENDEPKA